MEALSKELKNFLRRYFSSLEHFEIVLLLYSQPEKFWDATEISSNLGIDPIYLSTCLNQLSKTGLLTHRPGAGVLYGYRYELANPELKPLMDELVRMHQVARLRIIDFISESNRSSLSDFADAFVFKKDGEDG